MTGDGVPSVFNIPAGVAFADALAAGVLDRAGSDPVALSRYTVLLPTRRATRSLRDAFLRLTDGQALLLPRMMPLGDLDEDELAIAGADEEIVETPGDIPPAISGLRRQILLTRTVMAFQGHRISPDQAALLAQELARLLDQVQTEQLSFDGLAEIVPEAYARHWQVTLEFLKIVTQQWPDILAVEGCIDRAERRNRILAARAELWRRQPPPHPIIAAGSTGSIPATADLLTVVAGLPQGCIILPGMDRDSLAEDGALLGPTHPQFGLARLLERIGVEAVDVPTWPAKGISGSHPDRVQLMAQALRPASATDRWRALAPPSPEALRGITRLDCAGPDEEARAIALMLRGQLEEPGRTGALVTPDRQLARRVTAELRRWDIEVDDSAGTPLAQTPPGIFLRLTSALVLDGCAPVDLLAVCKHPLAAGGLAAEEFRQFARRLEVSVLRGPRPAGGLDSVRQLVPEGEPDLGQWLDGLAAMIAPFAAVMADPEAGLDGIVQAHLEFVEALASSSDTAGADRLWAGEAGEAAASFMAELIEAISPLNDVAGRPYVALLDALMRSRVVRPRFGLHPRLFIWGLLEARLQHTDLLILGGLNEGTWPPDAQVDPWMSRPMRQEFGLPLPERRIGLAAHDFIQASCAPNVVLSRAKRVDGTPTVPSRWLVRLEKLLAGVSKEDPLLQHGDWHHWQAALDAPVRYRPLPPPAPNPPLAARPRRLSVTQIEIWMRDPYAIYARHILNLRSLPPLDAPPDAAEYGTLVHNAIDTFTAAHPNGLPADAERKLKEAGRAIFEPALRHPAVWAFWWPRFERIADWFVAHERDRPDEILTTASEVHGELKLSGPGGAFLLTAIADRIERSRDGTLTIIDYKTGAPPRKREIQAGFAPQLPLEAAIAVAGGFDGVTAGAVAGLDYWRLRGGTPVGEISSAGDDPAAMAATALTGLQGLIAEFDREGTAYQARPRPDAAPRYSDYEHLARIKEWSSVESEGGA